VYHPELPFDIQPAFQVGPAALKQAGFVQLIDSSVLRLSNNETPTFDGSRGANHHDTASIMAAVAFPHGAAAMGESGFARPDAGISRAKHAPGPGFAGISRPVRTASRAIARLAGGHGAFS
jgi:hypothetical protein